MYRRKYVRRLSKRGKLNFFITIILVVLIFYTTITWILPNLVNTIGLVSTFFKPDSKKIVKISEDPHLAPPVLNIPYEATKTSQINISGFSTPNSKVNLYIDDALKQTADVSVEGRFLFENIDLSLGVNNIFGKTLDEKGDESLSSKTIRIIFDNEKPTLEISSPQDGIQIQGERKVSVEGTSEPDAKVYINGSQIILGKEGTFKLDQSLNDGENIFIIKAVDKALNETEIETRVEFTP